MVKQPFLIVQIRNNLIFAAASLGHKTQTYGTLRSSKMCRFASNRAVDALFLIQRQH